MRFTAPLNADVRAQLLARRSPIARKVLVVLFLAAAFMPALAKLFEYSGYMTVWFAQTFLNLGFAADMRWLVRVANAGIWTMILGALFGITLGLVVQNNILPYWLLFVSAVLLLQVVWAFWSAYGLEMLHAEWSLPEPWLHLIGVLCFAYIASLLWRSLRTTRDVAS